MIYLIDRYSISSKISKVLQRYCDGIFGFDQYVTRSGKFQMSVIRFV
jgi:hypothetical protein